MTSVLNMRAAGCAIAAVMGLLVSGAAPASAADLGGNCCADLEERIAELEATTARKGNRKVSLEISGHVNEALLFWDDGVESNVGVYTNDNARSRFRFKGEAKINDDWKAGYLIEIGIRTANSKRFTQDDDNGEGAPATDLRHNVWYVKSKTFGTLWTGLTGGAAEGITEVNLAATKDVAKYSDVEDSGLGLNLRSNGQFLGGIGADGNFAAASWRRLIRGGGDQPGEGRRHNLVRYDTPELVGFTATASWGEDDIWDVGVRYKGEFGDFKMAAGIAYGETTDANGETGFQCVGNNGNPVNANIQDASCDQLGGSLSVMHSPSGIYVNFAAGYMEDNVIGVDPGAGGIAGVVESRSDFYAGEVGIEQKWNALGKTTIFGQYYVNSGGSQDRTIRVNGVGAGGDIVESELTSWGGGVIQGVDAAAMHLYVTYRHYEADVTAGAGLTEFEVDDLDVVMGGAIIRF